jgi:hypothetical protein
MICGQTRTIILAIVVTLIANAQCYGYCATVACNPAPASSNHCHHHKSPHDNRAGCLERPSAFTGPEYREAAFNPATVIAILPFFAVDAIFFRQTPFLSAHDSGSPPSPAISILRI